jgi:hypothetical protein
VRAFRAIAASLAVGVLVFGGSACGGSGDSGAPTETDATATTRATTEESIPDELVGTWTTTLAPNDMPAGAPPELTEGGRQWRLEIAETGGPDGGPVLSIVSAEAGHLEGPALEVRGGRLLLKQEECAAGGEITFYDNEYAYEVSGETLEITTVSNQCPDRVAETILTSQPWRRVSNG